MGFDNIQGRDSAFKTASAGLIMWIDTFGLLKVTLDDLVHIKVPRKIGFFLHFIKISDLDLSFII